MSYYFGIMPQPIRHNKELKPFSKVLYSEIVSCLNENGQCTKRNAHFKKVLGTSSSTLSSSLTELRQSGFINVEIQLQKGTQKFIKRYITPANFSGEVNQLINNTHADNQIGVINKPPLKKDIDPNEYQATLLYNNNNINTKYIEPKIKHTPISKDINPEQLEMLKGIVTNFLTKQSKRFPHLYKDKDKTSMVNKSINTLYDIIKVDGIDYKLIDSVLKWVLDHDFWHIHITSLYTLRHKAQNGNMRFQNVLTDYQSKRSN
jgi:predicted transcriptional regulator|tara:strand:- start:164 stop:946 length:783 start_codon:yes stop_codon:yes gene_type:complete